MATPGERRLHEVLSVGMAVRKSPNFFEEKHFIEWKCEVLKCLSQATSPVHEIVHAGALPIFSHKSCKWFGVTASCRYEGQEVCENPDSIELGEYYRLQLCDLLQSKEPMVPKSEHTLSHSPHGFSLLYLRDLVVGLNNDVMEPRLHLNDLYPKRAWDHLKWELSGGDLLWAAAIIFALTRVRYMTVGEGAELRAFEEMQRKSKNNPKYFFYDKYILGKAKHIRRSSHQPGRRMETKRINKSDEDPKFVEILPERDSDSLLGNWLWENSLLPAAAR